MAASAAHFYTLGNLSDPFSTMLGLNSRTIISGSLGLATMGLLRYVPATYVANELHDAETSIADQITGEVMVGKYLKEKGAAEITACEMAIFIELQKNRSDLIVIFDEIQRVIDEREGITAPETLIPSWDYLLETYASHRHALWLQDNIDVYSVSFHKLLDDMAEGRKCDDALEDYRVSLGRQLDIFR